MKSVTNWGWGGGASKVVELRKRNSPLTFLVSSTKVRCSQNVKFSTIQLTYLPRQVLFMALFSRTDSCYKNHIRLFSCCFIYINFRQSIVGLVVINEIEVACKQKLITVYQRKGMVLRRKKKLSTLNRRCSANLTNSVLETYTALRLAKKEVFKNPIVCLLK